MKLVIEINLDNAAFEEPNRRLEVERILRKYVARARTYGVYGFTLRDTNGNTVGRAEVLDEA